MAVDVMCQAQRCDKSDKANCPLASPCSKMLLRPQGSFFFPIPFPSELLSLLFKGLRETFGWHSKRKAVKLMLTLHWCLNAGWFNMSDSGFSQEKLVCFQNNSWEQMKRWTAQRSCRNLQKQWSTKRKFSVRHSSKRYFLFQIQNRKNRSKRQHSTWFYKWPHHEDKAL